MKVLEPLRTYSSPRRSAVVLIRATSETAMPAQPQESSSPTSIPSKPGRPRPPYSSGTCTFISPSSCALAITSAGCVEFSSYSAALGRISFSANSRASARSERCSSVSANEIPPATPCSTIANLLLSSSRLTSQSTVVDHAGDGHEGRRARPLGRERQRRADGARLPPPGARELGLAAGRLDLRHLRRRARRDDG